jgi:hypothetical protein
MVIDALTEAPIEGALVFAMDETSAPVTDVVATDAEGTYVLPVSAHREQDGSPGAAKWRLSASADGYQPFPAGLRPAIPVDARDAVEEDGAPDAGEDGEPTGDGSEGDEDDAAPPPYVVENATTTVALIPLPEDQAGGVIVSGTVAAADPAGTLVVAEGVGDPAPYAVADRSGAFTLFNVPAGQATLRGYRVGLEVEPTAIEVADADVVDVSLAVLAEGDGLASLDGSVNIVDADGTLPGTSVVLIPVSVFNEPLERGPVPFGLRAPEPGVPVDIISNFEIFGVPSGTYKVLAAFENDELVRDPDAAIEGTAIQEVAVDGGAQVTVPESFKVTEALAVVSPGAEGPEIVGADPTFVWADDASETHFEVVVFDALGNEVWRDDQVPGVSGSDTAEVSYDGPALEPGMYYQFRATSLKETPQGTSAISRTEDLRGVFTVE